MKAIIYTRVSSDEQIKGTSLADQERRCTAYCEENGYEVQAVFREEGASAKTADRKELFSAMEFCRTHKGEIDFFVVFKLDRFARNVSDHFGVRKSLKEYGVELRSVSEQLGDEPSEKFMEAVIAAASEYDNGVRTQRATNGMVAKIREGIWPWKAPLGYVPNPKRVLGGKKNMPDVPDPATFSILQTAFREYAQGEHTPISLGRRLDALGLAAIRGKQASSQFIQQLLVERRIKFYAGKLITDLNGENEVQGLHQPMITETECASMIGYIHGKKKPVQRHALVNPNFPLKGGTVLCGACTKPLTGSTTRGRSGLHPYYHCYNKQCEMYGKITQKDVLENDFLTLLNKVAPSGKFIAYFKKAVIDEWENRVGQIKDVHKEYEESRRKLNESLDRIKQLLEDGTYSRAEYLERKQKIENGLMTTGISENESHIEQMDIEALLTKATEFLTSLGEHWKKMPPTVRPRFQKLVYPDGIAYSRGMGFGIARMGLIFELSKQFELGNYALVRPVGFEPTTVRLRGDCSTN